MNHIPEDSKLIYAVELLRQKIRLKLDSFLEGLNIDVFKFNFLMVLKYSKSPDGIKETDALESLLVVPEYIKKMQEELIISGLITVNIVSTGEKYLKLTDNGIKLIDSIYDKYQKLNSEIANAISEEDKEILQEKLLNWSANIR